MIGLTATTRSRRLANAVRTPGTARIVPIDTTGLDGAITIVSAAAIASRTPGAGEAVSTPANSILVIVSRAPSRTRYSWNAFAPVGVWITVRISSSLIGRTTCGNPEPFADVGRDGRQASLRRAASTSGADGSPDLGRPTRTTRPVRTSRAPRGTGTCPRRTPIRVRRRRLRACSVQMSRSGQTRRP